MKDRIVIDIGQIMDEIFEATRNLGESFGGGAHERKAEDYFHWNDQTDYYPSYSYPPMNVYLTKAKEMVFEFALAGFQEQDIQIEYQGDYMVFSAKSPEMEPEEDVRYFKRRLKFKPIENQRYYVPEDKFDREATKAVFKNGVLKITVPPKETIETKEGIKVEIVKEEDE
ncbi:MAG TPA: Hsp20/alpha crystallin family protein [Sediminispirochaeta sp.]|nr:Hsp20/alpha crystallin family protein [Sediminispirochaeta sp.]